MSQPTQNHADFSLILAKINIMIEESIYHTEMFAHSLITHHNDKAAEVFSTACEQFNIEQAIVMEYLYNHDLPNIPPWDTIYPGYLHPSSLLLDVHYLTTEGEARKIVDAMVEIHNSFYRFLIKESREGKVLSLANQLVKYHEEYGNKIKL